jgi:hypothetical protein
MLGSCPRDQGGKATEAKCAAASALRPLPQRIFDFRWRGGTPMISRRIRPPRTAASPDGRPLRPFQESPAMTSTCWFIAKRGNGLRTFRK